MDKNAEVELTTDIDLKKVTNPGSALGEAIGHLMEAALGEYIKPIVLEHSCQLLTSGKYNKKTGRYADLRMQDSYGITYSIDGVIVNEELQPLVLLESKYIRYKKHNRDKASWIAQAHGSLRDRFSSVRSCLAILAGSWSKPSLQMLRAYNICYFVVPFSHVVDVLHHYNVKFDWQEKDRVTAIDSHRIFVGLTPEQHLEIGKKIIEPVLDDVKRLIDEILDDQTPRDISEVIVEIRTTLGEVKRFFFDDRESALDFLEDFTFEEMMDTSHSFSIFDKPIE